MTLYKVMAVHYGKQPQMMVDGCETEDEARQFLNQQAEIVKGYYKRTGWVNGAFVVFGKGDIFKSQMWIQKYEGNTDDNPPA